MSDYVELEVASNFVEVEHDSIMMESPPAGLANPVPYDAFFEEKNPIPYFVDSPSPVTQSNHPDQYFVDSPVAATQSNTSEQGTPMLQITNDFMSEVESELNAIISTSISNKRPASSVEEELDNQASKRAYHVRDSSHEPPTRSQHMNPNAAHSQFTKNHLTDSKKRGVSDVEESLEARASKRTMTSKPMSSASKLPTLTKRGPQLMQNRSKGRHITINHANTSVNTLVKAAFSKDGLKGPDSPISNPSRTPARKVINPTSTDGPPPQCNCHRLKENLMMEIRLHLGRLEQMLLHFK